MADAVGWIDADEYALHSNGPGHPERPERLTAVRDGLCGRGVEPKLARTRPNPVARELLESVHTPAHVAQVHDLCSAGGGYLDPDTAVTRESWEAALLAAGAVADSVRRVLEGDWARAFCSVRPPGHHAETQRAMGFCVFDNVAVGAQAALNHDDVSRVAIIDWDVHHGNGTQEIFWRRPDVYYASWHQYPFYPGTGAADETGAGPGLGTTLNCPLPAGAGDADYIRAWEEQIRPGLERFAPDLLIISAGFDADRRDPLAALEVTAGGFADLSARVMRWAAASCGGRVVSVLEGGYDLEALAEDVPLHVETML